MYKIQENWLCSVCMMCHAQSMDTGWPEPMQYCTVGDGSIHFAASTQYVCTYPVHTCSGTMQWILKHKQIRDTIPDLWLFVFHWNNIPLNKDLPIIYLPSKSDSWFDASAIAYHHSAQNEWDRRYQYKHNQFESITHQCWSESEPCTDCARKYHC